MIDGHVRKFHYDNGKLIKACDFDDVGKETDERNGFTVSTQSAKPQTFTMTNNINGIIIKRKKVTK